VLEKDSEVKRIAIQNVERLIEAHQR